MRFTELIYDVLHSLVESIDKDTFNNVFYLAGIAEKEGVDLVKLTRKEYISYAEKHNCFLNSNIIRMHPSLRVALDGQQFEKLQEVDHTQFAKANRSFYRMSARHQADAGNEILPGVEVHPQTLNNPMWLYYTINGGLGEWNDSIPKAYVGLKDVGCYDEPTWMSFLQKLQQAGFSGSVKTLQNPQEARTISDQIVMHGKDKSDAQLGLIVAKQNYGDKVTFEDSGDDRKVNGEWKSYTQWLEREHYNRIK